MPEELKKSIEKKRKIADCIGIFGLYAVIIGIGLLFIALFQVITLEKFANDDYMQDPTIPYNERENASYILTPDDIESFIDDCTDFVIIGAVVAGIGIAVVGCVVAISPSKKERHKLVCNPYEKSGLAYCPECGLKMSLLDDKKHK